MSQMCPSCSRDNADYAVHCAWCAEPLCGLLGSNTLLEHRYRVIRVLGCGGMGAVYLADDLRIPGRQVAIKENLDPAMFARSQAEAAAMTGLRHPGLPAISDQFMGSSGRHYLVMDFIAGENLEELVGRRGPLPEAEVISLATQLLETLEYLHGHGVVHRDIKPANIKLTPAGRPVLVDFGIAKQLAQGGRTQTWARGMGSPGFAPPEQYTGGTDARSDLYSLGAVMYYLLTGKAPPEALRLAAGAPLTPPRQLRPDVMLGLQRAIFKAMAPAPAQRYQSAVEMRAALAALTKTVVVGPVAPVPAPKSARRGALAVAGAGAAVLVGLVIVFAAGVIPPGPPPTAIARLTPTGTAGAVPAGGRITDTAAPRSGNTPSSVPSVTPTASSTATIGATPTRIAPIGAFTPTRTPTRVPPTRTFTPTRIPPTNTPRPTATFTPEPPRPIASNVSGFGGSQGGNGWWYQVEQGRNSGNFADFPRFGGYGSPPRNCWQTPQEGHVRICEGGEVHPGITGRIAYRWRSNVSRTVRVVVHAHKIDTGGGDGVWVGVYRVPQDRPPEKIGEFAIAGAEYRDRPANTHTYTTTISVGDAIMVMVDIRGDSGYDQTRLYIDIY